MSKSAVAQHLAILVAAGLASATTVGCQRQYALVSDPLEEMAEARRAPPDRTPRRAGTYA